MKSHASVAICAAAFLLFLVWFFLHPISAIPAFVDTEKESIGIYLAIQANQLALMQCLLSILGIGIALVAIWGYVALREGAEKMAEDTVKEHLPELFDRVFKEIGEDKIFELLAKDKMRHTPKKDIKNELNKGITEISKEQTNLDNRPRTQ